MHINTSDNPAVHEGDCIENEWSQVSYDRWCRRKDGACTTVAGLRIVNLYEVVNSVIENDLTDAERNAARLFYFDGLTKSQIAARTGTTCPNVHAALSRAEKKLRNVLKHLIDCEEYKKEEEIF